MFHWIKTLVQGERDPQKEAFPGSLLLCLCRGRCVLFAKTSCFLAGQDSRQPPGAASLMGNGIGPSGARAAVGPQAGQEAEAELPGGLDGCVSRCPFPGSLLGSSTDVTCASCTRAPCSAAPRIRAGDRGLTRGEMPASLVQRDCWSSSSSDQTPRWVKTLSAKREICCWHTSKSHAASAQCHTHP